MIPADPPQAVCFQPTGAAVSYAPWQRPGDHRDRLPMELGCDCPWFWARGLRPEEVSALRQRPPALDAIACWEAAQTRCWAEADRLGERWGLAGWLSWMQYQDEIRQGLDHEAAWWGYVSRTARLQVRFDAECGRLRQRAVVFYLECRDR